MLVSSKEFLMQVRLDVYCKAFLTAWALDNPKINHHCFNVIFTLRSVLLYALGKPILSSVQCRYQFISVEQNISDYSAYGSHKEVLV